MPNHVDPEDAMRPGKDYTAEQLNGLLALLNSKYDLRGGDIDTHPVLGGIRFSEPPALDTAAANLPSASQAMAPWNTGY